MSEADRVIPHSKPALDATDFDAVRGAMESGTIAETGSIRGFEEAISGYLNVRGGVATSSGTTALFLALKALNIGPDDEVIFPSYVCRSVLDAVRWVGATPVLCDVGDSWCMDVDTVEPLLSGRTKAIIVVHIFGIAASAGRICDLGIPVVENICQAFGARRDGRFVGTFGDLAVCSFHATKLLTTGEGGMVVTDDEALLHRLREIKYGTDRGREARYMLPLSNMQAALGLSQLRRFDDFLARRRRIADTYFAGLAGLPVELPENIGERSIFFRFPLRTREGFESARAAFDKRGVQVRRGVDTLLHYALGFAPGSLPVAERLFERTLSIPIYPALTPDEVEYVVEVCRGIFGRK